MTFKEFVQERMEAFEALQLQYGMSLDGILKADLKWLIEAAGIAPEATKPHAQAWLKIEGAKRVKAVCDELRTFDDVPLLPTVKAVWERLYPNPATERLKCERCNGSGWISVRGPFETSAAYPCSHQPETEADRRMGVRISPALARHYASEGIPAEGRPSTWPENKGGNNAETIADIAAGRF